MSIGDRFKSLVATSRTKMIQLLAVSAELITTEWTARRKRTGSTVPKDDYAAWCESILHNERTAEDPVEDLALIHI